MTDFSHLSDEEIAEEVKVRSLGQSSAPRSPQMSKTDNPVSMKPSELTKRYGEAYLVARATNGIGSIFKTIGFLIAALVVVVGFVGADRGGVVVVIGAIVIAAVVFAIFFLLGTLVSAQGQILKATLDSAVNGSPFLTNEQKARIMSI